MRQVIYSSRATRALTPQELEDILTDAREGNERRGVTGVLIYASEVFVQILEGEDGVIADLLSSIRSDSRHNAMKVFHDVAIDERAFGRWRMAFLPATAEAVSQWTGRDDAESIDVLLHQIERHPQAVPRILLSIVKAISVQGPKH